MCMLFGTHTRMEADRTRFTHLHINQNSATGPFPTFETKIGITRQINVPQVPSPSQKILFQTFQAWM
jgi:hypothetical protein